MKLWQQQVPNILSPQTYWVLKQAVRQYGLEKVGTVTIPCQTMGLRKMQSYPFGVRFLADKIALELEYVVLKTSHLNHLRLLFHLKLE